MAISMRQAKTKIAAPALLTIRLLAMLNSPMAKMMNSSPPTMSPVLKMTAVAPFCTPKSLSALLNQLNFGQVAIAVRMNANTSGGATKPAAAAILSLFTS